MKFEIKKKILKPLCIYTLAFSMLLPSVASLADLDITLGGYSVVYTAGIEAPTVTKAFIGTNTISGGNLHRGKINGKNARGTVHVTLKDSSSNKKATVSVTPTSGTTWTVNLPDGVTIAEGDTVTAYQEFDGSKSSEVTAKAESSKANENKDKLKMPEGEIWIEQTSSNQVNEDEQAEAVELFKNTNTAIAGDIKLVKFSIDTAEHAYYEVTYTDGSTSGKIEATNLKIKQVTEHSRGATLGSITIVDNVIKGKLAGKAPFDGIKVQILLKLSDAVKDSYCDGGKCLVDKDTSDPVDATVNGETGEFTYTIPNPDLKLDQKVGVTVKEPHKFKSCSQTTVKPVVVDKTEVKDPRKLTADDKKAIDAAIRAAYTVNGESKLPNGSDLEGGVPSVIQFDDSGNVKIFSGGDVKGNWDNAGNFIPEKNGDDSYKLNEGAEPKITIPAKDLVKNIKPKSPAIAVDTGNGEVTITPPAYKDPGDDTDLASYTITYKDSSGAEKTVTATRDLKTNKWSGTGVDADTGVITLSVENIELAGIITATAKDNGGLEGDTDKLDSDKATKTLETATVSYDGNKGTGDMESKKLNKGSDYTVLPNTFTAPDDKQEFKTWEVNGQKVAAGAKIKVDKDTVVKAIWKDTEYKVSFDGNKGSGTMAGATVKKGEKYKLPDNSFGAPSDKQEFKTWEVDGKEVAPGTEITIDKDTVVKAIWKDTEYKVSFDGNKGSGTMAGATVKKGEKYKLPDNSFGAPSDKQEFKTWEVDGKEVAPNTEITINGDTVIKAIWKDVMVNVSYTANGGSGTMTGKELAKGSKYTLLDNAFKAPNDSKEFKAWEVNGKEVAAGTEITIDKDTVIKAIWKEKTTTNPSQPANPTDTPPTVNENPDGSTNVTPGPGTGKVVIPTTGKNGENPIDVVVEQDDKGKWENKNNVPGVTVDPDTGKTTIPADRKVDKDHIISESKPKVKPEEPSYEENEIPGIKIRDHYTPTFPVYVTVPKTEKVEKAEEVPVSLETHKAYIAGYEDNTLRAEGNLTRAEAAAMVTRLAGLGLSDNSMPAFKDMQKNAWYFRYINAAVKAKMLDADNGMMRPNDKITRAEFAKMLAAIDKENSSVSKFDDIKGHRYEKEINKIYGNNRIEGYEDGSFRPDAYLTRAESAAFLNRMFNRIADKEAYAGLEDKLAKFKDFDASKWYYDEMVEATNSHELTRRGKASDKFGRVYEKWTRILPSDVK